MNPTSGDRILAVFGAVDELEDATQRAIGASIAIHKEIADFRKQMKEDPPIPSILTADWNLHGNGRH